MSGAPVVVVVAVDVVAAVGDVPRCVVQAAAAITTPAATTISLRPM
ncbi:hypothetical protein [Nocardia concava]|nr:hypothetical protein [Nocardia concava]